MNHSPHTSTAIHVNETSDATSGGGSMPFLVVAALQDDLLVVTHDLDRLNTLLSESCDSLRAGFFGALQQLDELRVTRPADPARFESAREHLGSAVKALQFQDMASQLIAHTRHRLRHCADRLARDALADDEDAAAVEAAPLRPNPVTQAEMDTGYIELF